MDIRDLAADDGGRPHGRRRTLADVAAAAGTSVPTVSKVLRGGTDVSERTRAAVMAAADRIGYLPRTARPTSSSAPALIDFVVGDVHGSWIQAVLSGVEEAARVADHDVVLTVVQRDVAWLQRVLRRRSAGVVVALVEPARARIDLLHAAGRPCVLIDPKSTPPKRTSTVGVTNWDGGRMAAEHLVALGHRRFVVIGGVRSHLYGRARLDGFRAGLQGVADAVVLGEGSADWDRATAAVEAERLLREHAPTAVFCCSDPMAVGTIDAARRLGLRVPEDLSVVGFDDVPEASWVTPALTTVRQPMAEMGAAAVRMLLRGSPAPIAAQREELSTVLVERASTAPVPA